MFNNKPIAITIMPAPPMLHAARAQALPGAPRPYILDIVPTPSHLALHHPETEITLADKQTLQAVGTLKGAHTAPVTAVRSDGSLWSSGKDALVVRWDERSQRPVSQIKAHIRKPLPVTALAVSEADHLVIGGTELVSSEAHILFWDVRNTKEPAYRHSSTHSDEITHLSLLPLTSSFASSSTRSLPARLLLSGSVDGCVALSDMAETDEDEAVQAEENWNTSIAGAGAYMTDGGMRVWARSDMDTMATWGVGTGAEGELEFGGFGEIASDQFKQRAIAAGSSTLNTEYLITACPSLGVGSTGLPMVGAGTNDGNIVLEYSSGDGYNPSAFLLTSPGGHADVVRCMYHSSTDQALYTGSEDGVLAAWNLAALAQESAEEAEVEREGGMEVDGEEHEDEEARRRRERAERKSKKEKRREKRHAPY